MEKLLPLQRFLFNFRALPRPRCFYGLFKKEFALQSSSSLSLVNKLIIGPLVSLGTTGILYGSFFRTHPGSTLGGMSADNYVIFVAIGFLMHTYLNAGYYCFSTKILNEVSSGTLQILWIAPYHRVKALLSMASMEGLRCFVVLLLSLLIAGLPHRPFLDALSLQLLCYFVFVPICLTIGAIRAMVMLLNNDLAEILDHGYLIFVLTACPYIPGTLLPKILQPFTQINPGYHFGYVMRSTWERGFHAPIHLWAAGLLGGSVLAFAYLLWGKYRKQIVERCFL